MAAKAEPYSFLGIYELDVAPVTRTGPGPRLALAVPSSDLDLRSNVNEAQLMNPALSLLLDRPLRQR